MFEMHEVLVVFVNTSAVFGNHASPSSDSMGELGKSRFGGSAIRRRFSPYEESGVIGRILRIRILQRRRLRGRLTFNRSIVRMFRNQKSKRRESGNERRGERIGIRLRRRCIKFNGHRYFHAERKLHLTDSQKNYNTHANPAFHSSFSGVSRYYSPLN